MTTLGALKLAGTIFLVLAAERATVLSHLALRRWLLRRGWLKER